MESTSESLLRRLKRPDQELAWKRFVDLYAPLIFYWVRSRGLSSEDAADIVQEVLAIVVMTLPQFEYDPNRRFRGWLHTITANKTTDYFRRAGRFPVNGQEDSVSLVAASGDADLFEEQDYQSFLVQRALKVMQTEFRDEIWQACWSQVVDGQEPSDVAERLGLSLNVVYLAKSRVLKRLRDELAGLVD